MLSMPGGHIDLQIQDSEVIGKGVTAPPIPSVRPISGAILQELEDVEATA
jgi:hypothetical protein